jgi:hypothetical protein
VVVLAAVVLSCYGPHYTRCAIACSEGLAGNCPDGYFCSGVACIANGDTQGSCTMVASVDGGSSSDSSAACTWSSYTPANDVLAGIGPATDVPPYTGSGTIINVNNLPAGTFAVMHVTDFEITSGAIVTVVGNRPLIVVSDGSATIDGALIVDPASISRTDCTASGGVSDGTSGGGGGGGGFGSPGGRGGAGLTTNGGAGGDTVGSGALEPITLGCAGGSGGQVASVAGGSGGSAGGAIQISACFALGVSASGGITANGGGGRGGSGSGAEGGGGGGGASGGAILLEGSSLAMDGYVCAVGGGGGQGGEGSGAHGGSAGSSAKKCELAAGGVAANGGGVGGSAGQQGSPAQGSGDGGGGGGGGDGRICIRSVGAAEGSGQVSPVPSCQ